MKKTIQRLTKSISEQCSEVSEQSGCLDGEGAASAKTIMCLLSAQKMLNRAKDALANAIARKPVRESK